MEKWANSDPIKKEQLEMAERKGQAYWDGIVLCVALGLDTPYQNPITGELTVIDPKKINTKALIFLLKAKFPKIYRDGSTNAIDVNVGFRSKPFTIIEDVVFEDFMPLLSDPNRYEADKRKE